MPVKCDRLWPTRYTASTDIAPAPLPPVVCVKHEACIRGRQRSACLGSECLEGQCHIEYESAAVLPTLRFSRDIGLLLMLSNWAWFGLVLAAVCACFFRGTWQHWSAGGRRCDGYSRYNVSAVRPTTFHSVQYLDLLGLTSHIAMIAIHYRGSLGLITATFIEPLACNTAHANK